MSDLSKIEEKILFNRQIVVGKTKFGHHPVYLQAQIKEHTGGSKKNIDLKSVRKYKTLSISGHSKHFAGQIYDELNENEIEFKIPKQRVEEIKKIWKQWHLNDLKAGTREQEKIVKSWRNKNNVTGWAYDQEVEMLKKKKKYKQKGYGYGSGWLVKELPTNVELKIKKLF